MEAQTTNYNKTASEILEEARQKADSSEELKRLGIAENRAEKYIKLDGEYQPSLDIFE